MKDLMNSIHEMAVDKKEGYVRIKVDGVKGYILIPVEHLQPDTGEYLLDAAYAYVKEYYPELIKEKNV